MTEEFRDCKEFYSNRIFDKKILGIQLFDDEWNELLYSNQISCIIEPSLYYAKIGRKTKCRLDLTFKQSSKISKYYTILTKEQLELLFKSKQLGITKNGEFRIWNDGVFQTMIIDNSVTDLNNLEEFLNMELKN